MTQPTLMQRLMQLSRKDLLIYIVCLFALLACLFTINSVGEYQTKINEHWMLQYQSTPCWQAAAMPVMANITFNIMGDYNNG